MKIQPRQSSIRKKLPSISFRIAAIVGVLILAAGIVAAQNRKQSDEFLSCDDAVARQDYVVSEALNALKNEANTGQDGPALIVILRHGAGEKSLKLHKERLQNLEQYFRDRGSRLEAKQVLVAVGPAVEGNGRIEYYIFGRLNETIYFRRNGFICHECCGPDDRYYPHRKKAIR